MVLIHFQGIFGGWGNKFSLFSGHNEAIVTHLLSGNESVQDPEIEAVGL